MSSESCLALRSSLLLIHYSLTLDSFASLGMTNKRQNKTAKLHAFICQHDLGRVDKIKLERTVILNRAKIMSNE